MATIAVTAPTPAFTGERAGVTFQDGRGEVEADNASALAYFARHGYVLDEPAAPAKRGRTPARAAEADLDGSPAVDEPEG
jgi:hypothetical protein